MLGIVALHSAFTAPWLGKGLSFPADLTSLGPKLHR